MPSEKVIYIGVKDGVARRVLEGIMWLEALWSRDSAKANVAGRC